MEDDVTRPQSAPEGAGQCVGALRAAAILGVDERTVRRWADDGTLEVAYVTRGGHRRFNLEHLETVRAGGTADA